MELELGIDATVITNWYEKYLCSAFYSIVCPNFVRQVIDQIIQKVLNN